jgi:hypothetical protein
MGFAYALCYEGVKLIPRRQTLFAVNCFSHEPQSTIPNGAEDSECRGTKQPSL